MKEDAAEKAYQLGKEYEKVYKGCSQCVIAAVQDALDMRNDDVFKAATGLVGGGCGCIDGSCGAYSGAAMIVSSVLGRERSDFEDRNRNFGKNLRILKKLHQNFIDEYGSVVCSHIQTKTMGRPYYLPDRDELEKFDKAGGHGPYCPEVVGKASRWAAQIINELGSRSK
jgi:C_GCAxxG_C_C family probable redox protein